jgi:acyl-CoA synthetase (AMP-forming)/AMP-acid ligase II
MNIVAPIFIHCRSTPAEVALAAPGTEFNIVSYGRLARSIDNACKRIISLGLAPGSRVAVFIEDPIFHAIILIALTRLGIVTISGRTKSFTWRFPVDAVIADKPFNFPAPRIILADPGWAAGDDQPIAAQHIYRAAPDDVCRIFLTSGTTGDEKAVAVTHGMLADRIARQYLHFGSSASFCSRVYTDLALTTSLGFQLLIALLWRGGAMFLTGEPQATVNAFPIYGVQCALVAPGGLMDFLEAVEKRPQYQCGFKAIWTGGSSVPTALSERARMRLCADLTIAYGSTEATMVASMPAQFAAGIPGAAGYVFPGIAVQIVDDAGSPLPTGKEGIVQIKSRFGATEYLGDPEETARVFHDGWFRPGDLGYVTRHNMLVISGRSWSVLNVGGEKVNPERVEEILSAHPSVAQAAVLAMPNAMGVDEIWALIVPRSFLSADVLRNYCASMLLNKFAPAHFISVSEIPRNETGKIDRRKLPELVKGKLS